MKRTSLCFLALALALAHPSADALTFGDKLSLHGYLQNQTGMFIEDSLQGGRFNDRGTLSMQRNTLWLEGHYAAASWLSAHTTLRGTLSSSLDADRDANITPDSPTLNPRQRMKSQFYDEMMLRKMVREAYVDLYPVDLLSFRLGRQQVAWGETGSFRMLDVINPIDNSWHFSSLESFEDVRLPLWMAKAMVAVPWLNGDLEGVFVPALDKKADYSNIDPPQESAWYVHISPQDRGPANAFSVRNMRAIHHRPGERIEDSRFGARWKGGYDKLGYSLVWYQNHMLSGTSERIDSQNYVRDVLTSGFNTSVFSRSPAELHYIYPKNTIFGGSVEYPFEYPTATLARVEYVYEPHRLFPVSSQKARLGNLLVLGPCPAACIPRETFLNPVRREQHGFALVLERQTFIPFLNPNESFFVQAQLFERWVPNLKSQEMLLQASSYEDAPLKQWNTTAVLAVLGKYRHGTVLPQVVAAMDPEGSGFGQVSMGLVLGNYVRVTTGYNYFWGHSSFTGFGFLRDRDEVFIKTRLQF